MDAGKALVDHIFKVMCIDEEWSVRTDRGFSWWGGPLKQTIWAEEPFDDRGILLSRVHARTDMLRNFPDSAKHRTLLALTTQFSTLSGPLLQNGLLQSAASVYAHDQNLAQWKSLFSDAALIQVATAYIEAEVLASMYEAEVARSAHPESGERLELDQILEAIQDLVAPAGQAPSKYIGGDFEAAERTAGEHVSVLTTADETGLTSEFPFGEATALFQMRTDQSNPRLGNGLLTILTLPMSISPERLPSVIFELNRREALDNTGTAFLGSWCINPTMKNSLSFVSFYPNFCHLGGLPLNILMYSARRARWVQKYLSDGTSAAKIDSASRAEPAFMRFMKGLVGRN